MKENSNTDCVVYKKCDEISNELGQSLPGLYIYPNFARNNESESLAKRSKRISSQIDFNVIRDPNIPLGQINNGKNVCFFSSVIQVLYSLPVFRGFINKLRPPVTGVAIKIKKLFSEIETSRESVKTFNYVRYLGPQHYEPGMQYDAHKCLLQLLAKLYPSINDDCMFKINKLESTLCNDCGHATNNDGVCIDWSLHLEDSNNVQTINGMLHQLMNSRGEYLENYRFVDGCQNLNTSTKAVCVTKLSDALIVQLNIFKYIDGISKKFLPNLGIDQKFPFWGNRMVLSGVIYHECEQSHCGHYTSGVNVDNTWFLISDTRILRQQKLQCSSRDISVLYILIYKKKSNFLVAPPNSLNGTVGVSSTSELISETAETMFRQLAVDQEKEESNSNKVRSPMKRKSKFTNQRFRENDRRKKFMWDNLKEEKKEYSRKMDNKIKKTKHDNLDDNQIKPLRIYEKKVNKAMHVNLDDEKKEYIKKEDNKRKKEKEDNLDDNEKEHLRKRTAKDDEKED